MDAKTRADNRMRQQRYRELHRDEINEKRRERYEERKENSRCPRCGGKVKKGYTLCADCCDYQGALNKKYAKKRIATAGKPAKKSGTAAAAKKAVKAKKPVKKIASPKKAVKKTK
ncbi:MAG: hypothetical protein FWF29_06695 [Treponema sp.]|nr:hypothetical protein [Treponema sp.]